MTPTLRAAGNVEWAELRTESAATPLSRTHTPRSAVGRPINKTTSTADVQLPNGINAYNINTFAGGSTMTT